MPCTVGRQHKGRETRRGVHSVHKSLLFAISYVTWGIKVKCGGEGKWEEKDEDNAKSHKIAVLDAPQPYNNLITFLSLLANIVLLLFTCSSSLPCPLRRSPPLALLLLLPLLLPPPLPPPRAGSGRRTPASSGGGPPRPWPSVGPEKIR